MARGGCRHQWRCDREGVWPQDEVVGDVARRRGVWRDDDPPFDLVISQRGHGQAPDGGASGAALLRAAAVRRAEGKGTPPIVIFGGSDFEAENRRRALGLGALGLTSEWPMLMGLIERTLGQSVEAP